MSTPSKPLTNIEKLEDIPEFASEAEEHAFWASHELSNELWEHAEPLTLDELPAPTRPVVKLRPGTQVHLRADRSREGVVTHAREVADGFDYRVFFGAHDHTWHSGSALSSTAEEAQRFTWESLDELLRDLLLAKLRNPLTDTLYSYRASRTEFAAYQFRPALKFLSGAGQGLLIADEVGLGKTIEAAIIYLELKARLEISRVLVLCPSRLTDKWQAELRDRFGEEFQVLNAESARRLISDFERVGDSFPIHAIASFELFRRSDFLEQLASLGIPLDLLIVDEAHHLRNAETATHRLANTLVNTADAVLFLTATPINLHERDLYNLLSLISPDEFDSFEVFADQLEPNQHINQAIRLVAAGDLAGAGRELQLVERTRLRDRFLRNPYYAEALDRLSDDQPMSLDDRVRLQRELMDLNTLASVFTRTRKREIAGAAVRAPHSVIVELSPDERAFYEGILRLVRDELRAAGNSTLGFATIMKERQAASCLVALREAFATDARNHAAKLEVDRSQFDLFGEEDSDRAPTPTELLQLAARIGDRDSKFDLFLDSLGGALADDPTSKALVFSYFRRTLGYLHRRLRAEGYRVDVIHGGVPVDERRRIIEKFRSDPEQRVLLSSEVGAEGLDFQFCDVLVNYDLPWNPMQVEQRIGRLDRFGQEHERIRIFNFFLADTIETRIFQRLYDRIQIFERSIGDLEEILGKIILELSREALQAELTPGEQERKAEDAAAAIAQRRLAEDQLEQHKDELLGQGHILDQQIDAAIDSGRVLSAREVEALVTTYVRGVSPRSRLVCDEDEPCWTLTLDVDFRQEVGRFIAEKRLYPRVRSQFQMALNGQTGGRFAFTFDSDYARQRPNLDFITLQHPLAEAARDHWEKSGQRGTPASEAVVPGSPDEMGDGFFFVYVLDVRAAARRVTLEPIVVLNDGRLAPNAARTLLRALQEPPPSAVDDNGGGGDIEAAESRAAQVVSVSRRRLEDEVRQRNEALLAARATSIRNSFDAKIQRTTELLRQATQPRIIRMRDAQVVNLMTRQRAKLAEVDRRRDVVVSYELIAAGRARVVPMAEEFKARPQALSEARATTQKQATPPPIPADTSIAPNAVARPAAGPARASSNSNQRAPAQPVETPAVPSRRARHEQDPARAPQKPAPTSADESRLGRLLRRFFGSPGDPGARR